jgi:hypothetical protein
VKGLQSLTIHSNEDIYLLSTPQMKWKDVLKHRIARLFTEPYSQLYQKEGFKPEWCKINHARRAGD